MQTGEGIANITHQEKSIQQQKNSIKIFIHKLDLDKGIVLHGIFMNRALILTADGSHSVLIPASGITYHSRHGAVAESLHVFIVAGLTPLLGIDAGIPIRILEIGLGTGLNALLTFRVAEQVQQKIYYESIEKFPLEKEITAALNYATLLHTPGIDATFQQLHEAAWNCEIAFSNRFIFKKKNTSLLDFETDQKYNLVYFDAFSPADQPELWTEAVFLQLFGMMQKGAILVTYCSKSTVRKSMVAAGFSVTKIPGPHGKREMVRAYKPNH